MPVEEISHSRHIKMLDVDETYCIRLMRVPVSDVSLERIQALLTAMRRGVEPQTTRISKQFGYKYTVEQIVAHTRDYSLLVGLAVTRTS